MAEHKAYIRRQEWDQSGIASHKENCPEGNINFDEPEILATVKAKSKTPSGFQTRLHGIVNDPTPLHRPRARIQQR